MASNDALFNLDGSEDRADPTRTLRQAPIRDDQVAQIREAFARSGIESMTVRQQLVEGCVQRPTATLRDLRDTDVRFILQRIESYAVANRKGEADGSARSTWDEREADTWIDRL